MTSANQEAPPLRTTALSHRSNSPSPHSKATAELTLQLLGIVHSTIVTHSVSSAQAPQELSRGLLTVSSAESLQASASSLLPITIHSRLKAVQEAASTHYEKIPQADHKESPETSSSRREKKKGATHGPLHFFFPLPQPSRRRLPLSPTSSLPPTYPTLLPPSFTLHESTSHSFTHSSNDAFRPAFPP